MGHLQVNSGASNADCVLSQLLNVCWAHSEKCVCHKLTHVTFWSLLHNTLCVSACKRGGSCVGSAKVIDVVGTEVANIAV